jgi:hypothetical protein
VSTAVTSASKFPLYLSIAGIVGIAIYLLLEHRA